MSKTLLQCLGILEDKIKKGKKHYLYDNGICQNVAEIGGKFYTCQIKELVADYKHFSGDLIYPIGGMLEYNKHKENETLWVGDQLKMRLGLIKHLKGKL